VAGSVQRLVSPRRAGGKYEVVPVGAVGEIILDDNRQVSAGFQREGVAGESPKDVSYVVHRKEDLAMARIELRADGFNAYTASDVETGIDIDQASNMAGFYDSSTVINLTSDDTGTLSYDSTDFSFTQSLITATAVPSLPELPAFDNTTTFTLTTDFLEVAVTAGDMVADHLLLSGSDDAVTIAADGDTDHVAVTADGDNLISPSDHAFEQSPLTITVAPDADVCGAFGCTATNNLARVANVKPHPRILCPSCREAFLARHKD